MPKEKSNMVTLQYFNGIEWVEWGKFGHDRMAWISLGGDDFNYRTIDSGGNVVTDKSIQA